MSKPIVYKGFDETDEVSPVGFFNDIIINSLPLLIHRHTINAVFGSLRSKLRGILSNVTLKENFIKCPVPLLPQEKALKSA